MIDNSIHVLEEKIRDIDTKLEELDKGISFGDFQSDEIIKNLITDKNKLEDELQLISMNRFNFSK